MRTDSKRFEILRHLAAIRELGVRVLEIHLHYKVEKSHLHVCNFLLCEQNGNSDVIVVRMTLVKLGVHGGVKNGRK